MNNSKKVWRQFEINAVIMVCSIVIIYIGLVVQHGWNNVGWLDGLNAELVFLMISSLGAVVGWRVVEAIKVPFGYNVILIIALLLSGIEYTLALVYKNNEVLRMFILYSGIPFFTFYTIEQMALFKNAKEKKSIRKLDSFGYREEK